MKGNGKMAVRGHHDATVACRIREFTGERTKNFFLIRSSKLFLILRAMQEVNFKPATTPSKFQPINDANFTLSL